MTGRQPDPIRFTVDADTRGFKRGMQSAERDLKGLEKSTKDTLKAKVEVDDSELEVLRRRLRETRKQLVGDLEVGVDVDVVKTVNKIQGIERKLKALDRMDVTADVKADVDTTGVRGALRRAISGIEKGLPLIGIGVGITGIVEAGQQVKQFAEKAFSSFGQFEQTQNVLADVLGLDPAKAEEADRLVKQIGASSRYSAGEVSKAAVALSKAGLSYEDIAKGALDASTALAATEGIDVEKTAEVIANAQAAFGYAAKDLPKIADSFAAASTASTASVGSLAYGLSQVSASAAGAGMSLEDTLAALATLDQMGIKGSDAGTSLKTFFATLIPKSKTAGEAMAELGLEFFTAEGKMKPMIDVIGELEDGFKGLSDFEKKQALNDIFGSDASRAAQTFATVGVAGYKKMLIDIEKLGPGQAAKMALVLTEGFEGAKERLGGSMENLFIAFGEAFGPAIAAGMNLLSEKVIPKITAALEKLDPKDLADRVKSMSDDVDRMMGRLDGWTLPDGDELKDLGDAFDAVDWGAVREAFKGIGDAMGIVGGGAKLFVDAFRSMPPGLQRTAATVAAMAGAWKLMKSSPVLKVGVGLVEGALRGVGDRIAARFPKFPTSLTTDAGTMNVRIVGQPVRVTGITGAAGAPDRTPGRTGTVAAGITRAGVLAIAAEVANLALPSVIEKFGASPKAAALITGGFEVATNAAIGAYLGSLVFPGIGTGIGAIAATVLTLLNKVPETDRLRVDVDDAVKQAGAAGILAGAAAAEAAKAQGAAIRAVNEAKSDVAKAQGELNAAIARGDKTAIDKARADLKEAESRLREADLREKAIRERQKLYQDVQNARLRQEDKRIATMYDLRMRREKERLDYWAAVARGADEDAAKALRLWQSTQIELASLKRDVFGEITMKPGDAYQRPKPTSFAGGWTAGYYPSARGQVVYAPTVNNYYPKPERASDSVAMSLRLARYTAGVA